MDEAALIEGLRRGDAAAREAVYLAHRQGLYATACHFLGYQDPEAEDMVHEAFAVAYAKISGFEGRSSLYTWLTRICVNLCFARIRKRKRQVATEGGDLERMLGPRALGQAVQADEAAQAEQRRAKLGQWLRELGELCREMLRLRLEEGLTLSQMKQRLKLPLGTVAARVTRCQAALKAMAEADRLAEESKHA
jgi:RNA polymerase sigma-70 factor (ECF subfamily)